MKALYRMKFECGRQGNLSGIFIADTEDIKILVEHEISISFGEVLGKHSDVRGYLEQREIEMITDDEKVISIFREYNLSSGYNPFHYPVDYSYKEQRNWKDDITVAEAVEILKGQ
jgi:hypothetical protein